MKTRNSAILSGVAALVVVAAVLGVSTLAGVPLLNKADSNTTPSATSGQSGTLSVLLTDPPHVPEGVTAVYVTYSNLAVHMANAGNQSGWTRLSNGGSINLMSTVNVSQTIAEARAATGTYNGLRLNVTAAEVTFGGKNYTAFVVNSELFIPITRGGIQVNDSKPSATIIDISPTVMNIGSSSNPEFVIRSAATAYPVPSSQVTEEMKHEGFRFSLLGKAWWSHIRQNATANLEVTNASLASASLSVSVKAQGHDTSVKLIVVSPLASVLKGQVRERMPTALFGSAIFVVEGSGTVVPLQRFVKTMVSSGGHSAAFLDGLRAPGFNMTAGSAATYSYSGQISLGFSLAGLPVKTVVGGQQYMVTVLGTDALASYVVVAG